MKIDVSYIEERFSKLKSENASRRELMDIYEKVYNLDLWGDEAGVDERRVSLPIGWNVVEAYRSLLLTSPPVISVPASEVNQIADEHADRLEKYLYACWYQLRLLETLNSAEWYACCLGEGVLRCVYDDMTAKGELPLLVQALDPRNVYATAGVRAGYDVEVLHAFNRTRRDIQDEWGVAVKGDEDEKVAYIDYWRADVEDGERKITNAVVADGKFIKRPVVMPGYTRLPFIRYPGIATPLAGSNGTLSVLFPLTGGSTAGRGDTKGLIAALSEMVAMRQQTVENAANGAMVVYSDGSEPELDLTPGTVNYLHSDTKVAPIMEPGPHPVAAEQIGFLERQLQDASVSAMMMGRYAGDMSGVALSMMSNPVLMRVANRQQNREWAYQQLNEMILGLTDFYATEGWEIWGQTDRGEQFELAVTSDDIKGYYRNSVKLSASLPRDSMAQIQVLAGLASQGLISNETFLDQFQQIFGLASQSVQDEMKRILRDKLLMSSPLTEKLAKRIVEEYGGYDELFEEEKPQMPPEVMPPGMPPGMMPPGGAPQGLPPSVTPPTPESVGAAGNLEGMLNLMEQGGPPPFPLDTAAVRGG